METEREQPVPACGVFGAHQFQRHGHLPRKFHRGGSVGGDETAAPDNIFVPVKQTSGIAVPGIVLQIREQITGMGVSFSKPIRPRKTVASQIAPITMPRAAASRTGASAAPAGLRAP